MLPRERSGPDELMRWLEQTQECNERIRRSHAKRRAALRVSPNIPPGTVVVILTAGAANSLAEIWISGHLRGTRYRTQRRIALVTDIHHVNATISHKMQ